MTKNLNVTYNMKTVILAGGFGTRISEESHLRPKPMIEIGEKPILWHIMKLYSHYGHNDFIICCGYKQHMIKEWFADYYLYNCDVTFDFTDNNRMTVHNNVTDPWKVTLVDTGLNTMTGGRIGRIEKYVGDEPFFLTYGDAVSDVNPDDVLNFHRKSGKKGTITAINVDQRFGVIDIREDGSVNAFREKNETDSACINGGFMVMEPEVFRYITGDDWVFEKDVLPKLAGEDQLAAYSHGGFWQCMDTARELKRLEDMWKSGNAPWKVW